MKDWSDLLGTGADWAACAIQHGRAQLLALLEESHSCTDRVTINANVSNSKGSSGLLRIFYTGPQHPLSFFTKSVSKLNHRWSLSCPPGVFMCRKLMKIPPTPEQWNQAALCPTCLPAHSLPAYHNGRGVALSAQDLAPNLYFAL